MLISKKASINARSGEDGWTPLHCAATEGHIEVAELLLEKGANANAQDNSRMTPLDYARNFGNTEMERLLAGENQKK